MKTSSFSEGDHWSAINSDRNHLWTGGFRWLVTWDLSRLQLEVCRCAEEGEEMAGEHNMGQLDRFTSLNLHMCLWMYVCIYIYIYIAHIVLMFLHLFSPNIIYAIVSLFICFLFIFMFMCSYVFSIHEYILHECTPYVDIIKHYAQFREFTCLVPTGCTEWWLVLCVISTVAQTLWHILAFKVFYTT